MTDHSEVLPLLLECDICPVWLYNCIYIYLFWRCFYPKWLTRNAASDSSWRGKQEVFKIQV